MKSSIPPQEKRSGDRVNVAVKRKKLTLPLHDVEDVGNSLPQLPPDFEFVWKGILDMRVAYDAPVDTMGCDKLADPTCEPKVQVGKSRISCNEKPKHPINALQYDAACMDRLKTLGLTVNSILSIDAGELENVLRGVSFHKTKARNLKKIADILSTTYDGDVPDTYEGLCSLPGIGPKMALIALHSAWGRVEGIAVDVHVHRITNRLGWIQTKTPEQSCVALTRIIPRNLFSVFNSVLVGFGQQRCKALNPLCDTCLVQSKCPYGQSQLQQKKIKALQQDTRRALRKGDAQLPEIKNKASTE